MPLLGPKIRPIYAHFHEPYVALRLELGPFSLKSFSMKARVVSCERVAGGLNWRFSVSQRAASLEPGSIMPGALQRTDPAERTRT